MVEVLFIKIIVYKGRGDLVGQERRWERWCLSSCFYGASALRFRVTELLSI